MGRRTHGNDDTSEPPQARASNVLQQLGSVNQLNWNDVNVFLTLARFRNLSQAARHLGVNHTTVGRRIRALEGALSVRLFERTPLGFLMTEAGQGLLAHAEGMEAHAHSIALDLVDAGRSTGGTVRVATMEALGSLYLAPRFERLYRDKPNLWIELVTASHWINLSKREADILISFPKPKGHRITVEKIGEFALHLYASRDYLKRMGSPRRLDDLADHKLIDYIDELVQISAVRWLSDVLADPSPVFRSTSLVAQYHAAASGMGIAMLPTFVAAADPRLERVLGGIVEVRRDFWLAAHQDLLHLVRVRDVMSFLSELIERDREFLLGRARRAS